MRGGAQLEELQELKALGESLRTRRKEMNVSLKEAENATSIRMNYLQALEEGEMNKLISPIYAQGFFMQYSAFLGLDGENIVREKFHLFMKPNAQEFIYGIGTLEGRANPGSNVKWFPNALWIFGFIAVLVAAWYTAHLLGVLG